MTLLAITFALLATLASSARAGGDVGVIVTGEGSMQPQLAAQIEAWLSQHGHTLVPSPLPPEAINALVDCFVVANQPQGCARDIFEKNAKSSTMLYARLDSRSTPTGARDVTLTAYWFDKGHDAVAERKTCERCTDQTLRTAADELMKKLVGGGDVGHIKLSSNPPGARITIDGQAIGVTPLDWDMPPGKHTIKMDKDGLTPASRDIVVYSNKSDAVGMVLAPIAAPPPITDHPSQLPTWAPIGITAVGGAAIVTGIVLIAIDEDPETKLTTKKTYLNSTPEGVGFLIGGVVATGIGTYLLLHSPKATSAPVAAFTGDAGYIGWLGRF